MRLLAITALGALWPGVALAHLDLLEPPQRYAGPDLKDGPCGIPGGNLGPVVAVYEPGQTLSVVIDETIDHPSHYRVAFDDEGDDDFRDPVCLAGCETGGADPVFAPSEGGMILADHVDDAPAAVQTLDVTLPDVECEACVLQVIQVMYDKRPYVSGGNDIYYRCADIALRRDASAMDLGPPRELPDLGPPDGGAPATEADSGCSAAGAASAGTVPLLALLALRRRRRGALGLLAKSPPWHARGTGGWRSWFCGDHGRRRARGRPARATPLRWRLGQRGRQHPPDPGPVPDAGP